MEKQLTKNVVITNKLGLHARPAAMIAKAVQSTKSKVWISKDREKVDASSIIDILTLACLKGTTITIEVENVSDIDILNTIADLFDKEFGE